MRQGTLTVRRELSDEDLLVQLETYLEYQAKEGAVDFWAWAESKGFAPGDSEFLRVALLGVGVARRRAS